MWKTHFITIIFILLSYTDGIAKSYVLKHLDIENGLSNNYVTDIVQDRQGFIWIATEAGLNRFDGRHFTHYKDSNSEIGNSAITSLLYDEQENRLWIGTKTTLSILNCSTYQFEDHTENDNFPAHEIIRLSHASDGGIWITTYHNGIIHYDKKTKEYTSYSDKNIKGLKKPNWSSFDDGKGHLYVGHAQNGLSIIDLKNKSVRHFHNEPGNPESLPGNSVYSIFADHSGNIWIGTNQGLALFNQRTENFLVFKHEPDNPNSLIADHIYCIKEMNDGTLWIASDIGGISILDLYNISFANPETVKFLNLTSNDENSLSSGNIRSLLQDSYGNIWIGNYSSGIDFISHTQPVFHTLPYTMQKGKNLKNKPVWGIYADSNQQVWAGSENEVAVFKDNRLTKTLNITKYQHRPYAQAFTIRSDRQHTILLGLYDDGLLKLDTRNNDIERIDLGMDNIDVITFAGNADDTIWIGAEYGIYSYANGTAHKEKGIIRQLTDRAVYGILFDRQGKMWVGTYSGGICIFDKERKLIDKLNSKNGFCSNNINQLYMDSNGGIWAATRNGIAYIKDSASPRQYLSYNASHGLEDSYIRAIQEDLSGNIWVSTNNGISFWNKRKQKFDNYDHRDGIPAGNFIEGSACITSDGTIYFGSLNGVCYFNPETLALEHPVAPVRIIDCKGFNRQAENRNDEFLIPSAEGHIGLPYQQNSFRISFTVPDYSQSQQVEYAYMMEGLDNIWYNTHGENQITFRNISPGKYTFKVKARLKNKEWDEDNIAAMTVHVYPPLWLTWYAKLFYIFIACLIMYAILRFYKHKIELESSLELEKKNNRNKQELNNERLRFYTNVTHELRTPLTLILGPLEDLLNDKKLPSLYRQKVHMIHNSAVRLLNLINELLEFRKTETQNRRLTVSKGDLGNLITEIGLRYKELNQNKKVTFHIRIETEETRLYFDADMITSILNNLLSNAVKYTPEGEIRLTLRVTTEETQYTEIEVSDTGYGIEKEALPHIFDCYYQAEGKHQASGTGIGLALVKSLAELHEGILVVASEVGKGTTFTFRILTGNTYPGALHKEEREEIISKKKETGFSEDEQEEKDMQPIILVVEDNDDIRGYITSSFDGHFQVLTATNGKEGVELAQQHIPNIIISDIMMPIMDGIELCRIIKEDVRTSHIPVILLTAKDSIQDKEEGYESGADSYLTKPFSAKLLHSRIHNLLESRRRLAQQINDHTRQVKPEKNQEPIKLNRLDQEFLSKLTCLIEENLDATLDIPYVTARMNMSHSSFYRKVKALTGVSANEFIRKVRLKNSVKLLMSGSYNISEAAYMTGFNNIGYYRECFKEEYGMSPSEYLKQQKDR